jgi:hypothetical protein
MKIPQANCFSSCREQTKDKHSTTVTFLQRILLEIRSFTKGIELLLDDYRTYRNIEAAEASSRRNSWVNCIPRRQLEQRRQFLSDIQIALPTVALFMLPIIGYAAPLLAFAFPRQLLSRQFHTAWQQRTYATEEYNVRKLYYVKLTDLLIRRYQSYDKDATTTTIVGSLLSSNAPILYDEAGPVICNMKLFVQFIFHTITTTMSRSSTLRMHNPLEFAGIESSLDMSTLSNCTMLDSLSREHLHLLFMTTGYTKLPPYVATLLYNKYLFPSSIMKSVLRNVGSSIVHDDASLLQDLGDLSHNYDLCALHHLTDEEVLEACTLRGLPVDTDIKSTMQMRKCLYNHLLQMGDVKSILSQQEVKADTNHDLTKNMIRWPSNYKDSVHDFLILISLQMVSLRHGLRQASQPPGGYVDLVLKQKK